MKRKLAWAAAILIVALVSAAFLRPAGLVLDYSPDDLLRRYTDYLDYHTRRFGDFPLVTVEGITLRYWNTADTCRFSATFAENIDGSGERYTIEIPLSFSEAE